MFENRVRTRSRVFGKGKDDDWRPCSGQGGEPPQWSNDDGSVRLDLADVEPDEGWSWLGNWKIEIGTDCDRKGWQYATKYERFRTKARTNRARRKRTDKFSRRKWVRTLRRQPTAEQCVSFDKLWTNNDTTPCCKTLAKSYLYVINTLFILVGLATLAASVAITAQDR